MFPLGINSWFGYSLPLEKCLEMIKKAGFDATCLWFGHEEKMVRDGRADQMPGLVRGMGLALDNIHAPYEHSNLLWSELPEENELIRQELITSLQFCSKHEIPIIVLHITKGAYPPPITKNGLRIIQDLVNQAEGLGITMALENTRHPAYLEYIFSNIQSPNLGFCYDSSHDFLPEQSRGRELAKWGDLLVTTHLADNNGINDDHLLPGKGTIDWQAVERYFPNNSYKGVLMLEVDGSDSSKGFTPEEFLQNGYQWLRQFGKRLANIPSGL